MDHNDKDPFDCKDKLIEFICDNLNHHGFGFLLHEDLDEIQLDLLMIASWSILRPLFDLSSDDEDNPKPAAVRKVVVANESDDEDHTHQEEMPATPSSPLETQAAVIEHKLK
jgi:hypothetical protein